MQYIGSTDPSGWVICNGQARSNASGIYTNILTSQLVNVPNANNTILNAPLNKVNSVTSPATWGNAFWAGIGNYPIACSNNGQVMAAVSVSYGGVYISTNSGNNWTNYNAGSISGSTSSSSVSMNSTGSTMIATCNVNAYLHMSTNGGITWYQTSCPACPTGSYTTSYDSISMSLDGKAIIVTKQTTNTVYYTTNSGNYWTLFNSAESGYAQTSYNTGTCAVSPNGNVFALNLIGHGLYVSSNSGSYWSRFQVGLGSLQCISLSNNGSKIVYVLSGNNIWLSTNYGQFFYNIYTNTANANCSISGDGTIIAISFYQTNNISVSTNSGNNWTNIASSLGTKNWDAIVLSNDGSKLIAGEYNGGLYVSNTAFSSSTFYSTFTPMNIAPVTSIDGSTLNWIYKY